MLELLRQPFPFSIQTGQRLRTALYFGLFVFLFLFIFRPFGMGAMGTASLALATFLYGVVCFTVLTAWFLLLPLLFPGIFRESAWTVWKEILHSMASVLAVCAGNILFTHYYFHEAFSFTLVLKFLWMTVSVSIIPIIVMVLLRQMRLMRSFSRQAIELDRQLPVRPEGISQQEGVPGGMAREGRVEGMAEKIREVEFSSENGQDSIHLPVTDFLYAEAADNYVKVFYQGGQKIIRSSLKRLEDEMRAYEQVFRCHRTYLVNLDKVVHISGNAQGYKLHLEGIEPLIPVSRSLNGEVTRLVTRPKEPSIHPTDL
jgi:hypothetical protein